MSLEFEVGTRGDIAVVTLIGRIDRDADTAIEAAYTAAIAGAPAALELDFNDVEYINSTGIALIVGLLARARAQGVSIRATGLTPHYVHIFEITRLSDFIEIVQPAEAQGEK
jgi:anti-sigma B factor antagonist